MGCAQAKPGAERDHAVPASLIANGEKLAQMPKKKYIVTLTDQERSSLEDLTKKGKSPAYKVNHARILLLADTNQSEGGWSDRDISQALNKARRDD